VCRLRRDELLEAAHILPDAEPLGIPAVTNGLALCTLHHAAFDRHVIGITPDYVVEVRRDVLEQEDGPMLIHRLQGFHGKPLRLPRREAWQPDRHLLEERYSRFRRLVGSQIPLFERRGHPIDFLFGSSRSHLRGGTWRQACSPPARIHRHISGTRASPEPGPASKY
jgi:hypothetical protein